MDPQPGVDDGPGVAGRTHLTRARGVVDGEGEVAQGALPVLVRVEGVAPAARHLGQQRSRAVLLECLGGRHVQSYADTLDQRVDVLSVCEVVGFDDRVNHRVPETDVILHTPALQDLHDLIDRVLTLFLHLETFIIIRG